MSAITLSSLKKRRGIDSKALGRGIGSGCGKTSSYGHKGGKARSGRGKVSWFEGGQTPIYRRLPKRGFVSMKDRSIISYINLDKLQKLFDEKLIKSGQEVNLNFLQELNVIGKNISNIRLLAKGTLTIPLKITVNYASAAAVEIVKSAGGEVEIVK